jgi:hypothetical protein
VAFVRWTGVLLIEEDVVEHTSSSVKPRQERAKFSHFVLHGTALAALRRSENCRMILPTGPV